MRQLPNKYVQQLGFIGNVLSIGLAGGICIAIGLFIGYQFDLYFSTKPYGIIWGIVTGIAAAVFQMWKQLQESMGKFASTGKRSKDEDSQV